MIDGCSAMIWPPLPVPQPTGKALVRAIVITVAERHGVDPDAIYGRNRSVKVCTARWDAFAAVRAATKYTLPQVGAFFGRDHSTVLHGLAKRRALAREAA